MKKVFMDFNELPRMKCSERIDWKRSVGKVVKFQYNQVSGDLKIESYDSKTQRLYIDYNDAKNYKIGIVNFKNGQLGNLIGVYTDKFKFEIGDKITTTERDFIIRDRMTKAYHKKNGKKENKKWYKYKCNKCGWDEGWIDEGNLLKGKGCSCCVGKTVVEGINDVPTTDPWMVKYFIGGYNEAKLYTRGSDKKVKVICPYCGEIKKKKISLNYMCTRQSIGCICGDGSSYPERFLFSLLKNFSVSFEREYVATWSCKKRYDFYFEIFDEKYIVECNGAQHPGTKHWDANKKYFGASENYCNELKNDEFKKELAMKNGIKRENYIVLDCSLSDFNFIKKEIEKSNLSKIFDLESVCWSDIEERSHGNISKQICDYWNNVKDIEIVAKHFGNCTETIRKNLVKGNRFGWCVYGRNITQKVER